MSKRHSVSPTKIELDSVPFDQLREAFTRRKREMGPFASLKVKRPCLGCGKLYSAREMRTHDCPSGMSYWRRAGYTYDAKKKKYVPPKDWKWNPKTRRYITPAA
jgi:hypothetical protein